MYLNTSIRELKKSKQNITCNFLSNRQTEFSIENGLRIIRIIRIIRLILFINVKVLFLIRYSHLSNKRTG